MGEGHAHQGLPLALTPESANRATGGEVEEMEPLDPDGGLSEVARIDVRVSIEARGHERLIGRGRGFGQPAIDYYKKAFGAKERTRIDGSAASAERNPPARPPGSACWVRKVDSPRNRPPGLSCDRMGCVNSVRLEITGRCRFCEGLLGASRRQHLAPFR